MKTLTVKITPEGSQRALPAIWYGGKAHEQFEVTKPKQWRGVYEVVEGDYKGMLIDMNDCETI